MLPNDMKTTIKHDCIKFDFELFLETINHCF